MRRKSTGAIPFSLPMTVASALPAQLPGSGSPSPSSPSTVPAPPSSASPTRAPSTRDLLDALRLLYSGRVFTSYQLQSPSSPPSQQDWYCFVDVEQPRESGSALSKADPEEKEQEAQAGVSDQGGVLYWTVVTSSHPSKQKLGHQCVPLSCISSILLGKQSPPLLHPSLSGLRDDCCFSISTSRSACYSLSSPSPVMLVSFLLALKRLMQANRCSQDQLSLRGVVRRGLKDGVLTALTPSTPASASSSSSSSASLLSPQLPDARRRAETAQGHRRQLTVAASHHQRSRSQTPSALFRQLADLPVSAVNAPLRSLSPLPLDGKKGAPEGRQGSSLIKTPSSDAASSTAATAASSSSAASSPYSVAWSQASASDSASVSVAASPMSPPTASPSPSPTFVVPSLSSLLSPGDPSNQFTLLNRIGQSPSSIVYRALYRPLQTHVAVKVVELSPASSAQIAAEVSHLSRTHSEYMVGYVGCWRKGGAVWIVQELMIGGSLADFMVVTGHVLLELEICAVVLQCLHALRLFHRERRIHRDVKAANVLINASGQAKLADCGTAIQLSSSAASTSSAYAHTAIGSPFWMAPEVLSPAAASASASPAYDTKADIWSLGITALELAYGDPPRHTLQPAPLLHAIVHDAPPSLDRTRQRWTDEFAEFISLCLVKEPSRRASAEELLQSAWMQRMELEEGKEVLSAMWRAWGDRVERYRVVTAEMERKQQEERERERQRERQLQPARMGPADWNPLEVEYSLSSSQHSVPHFSHHSRSLSPSSVSASSSSRRVDSQSGDQEPPSPSVSSQLPEGGAGGGAGGGKVRRSMSFSQSFSAYGDDKREEEAELAEDEGDDREEEEERLTVMDYDTPTRRRSPVKTRRPPVPIFPSPASASSVSTSAASPHPVTPSGLLASVTPSSILSPASHSIPMIGSPVKVHLAKSASYTAFPPPSSSPTPPSQGSIAAASPVPAAMRVAVEDDDAASPTADTEGLPLTSGGRRDISYTAELSAGSGLGLYGRGRGEEEGDGDGEEASFSRQIVYADDTAAAASDLQDDADAFSSVFTYSQ